MEDEFLSYYKTMQIFIDDVKKDIINKTNNLYNLKHSRDILNSLFNLFDYQITLMNQIILYSKSFDKNNNKKFIFTNSQKKDINNTNDLLQKNNINHLININKDIMVSMIMKFLSKINSILNRYQNKINEKNNNLLNKGTEPLFNKGKIINLLYSNNSNKNYLMINNSSRRIEEKNNNSNIKKASNNINNLKNINSFESKSYRFPQNYKNSSQFNYDNDINKSLKNNNKINKFINKKNANKDKIKNISIRDDLYYKGLITDIKIGDKMKNKKNLHKSYSCYNKDMYIDLNDKALKNLFNMPLYYNSNICTKASKEE